MIGEDGGEAEEVGEGAGARVIAGVNGCDKSASTFRKLRARGELLGTGSPKDPWRSLLPPPLWPSSELDVGVFGTSDSSVMDASVGCEGDGEDGKRSHTHPEASSRSSKTSSGKLSLGGGLEPSVHVTSEAVESCDPRRGTMILKLFLFLSELGESRRTSGGDGRVEGKEGTGGGTRVGFGGKLEQREDRRRGKVGSNCELGTGLQVARMDWREERRRRREGMDERRAGPSDVRRGGRRESGRVKIEDEVADVVRS